MQCFSQVLLSVFKNILDKMLEDFCINIKWDFKNRRSVLLFLK